MNLCSFNHEEIVYLSRQCPLCVTTETIEELENKLDDQMTEIETLKEEIEELKSAEDVPEEEK